jgi:hypothetical protein
MAQGTRPRSKREFMNTMIDPYKVENFTGQNPNAVFSEPKKAGQPEINRALEVSVKKSEDKEYQIGIKDIDEAVMYYFNNTLKLSVNQNNTKVDIPVIYGTPENWKSFQLDGYYRNKEGRLMAPLLVFKRQSIAQNRNLGNKLDGNQAHNMQMFEKKYSSRNYYSNFSVLNNRSPETEYLVSMTPDYVTVQYECVVWTYFIEQMDKVIESLNFASRAYWGDPNRFQFYSEIETFTDSTTYEQGEDRAIRVDFGLTLNGYLIPDTLNKTLATKNRVFGISKLIFGLESTNSDVETLSSSKKSSGKQIAKTIAADSVNKTVNQYYTLVGIGEIANAYLSTQITKIANTVYQDNIANNGVAIFLGTQILQPPSNVGIPNTTVEQFTFSINGQQIPTSYVTIAETPTSVVVYFNTSAIGYGLESDDEVTVTGKFTN